MRLLQLLFLYAGSSTGLDPLADLGGKDLACSACTLVSNTIEKEVLQLSGGSKKKRKKASKQLAKALNKHCDGIKNMATIGEDGKREYVDLAMALGQDTQGRKKTNLAHVKMGPDVTKGLKDGCLYFSELYVKTTNLKKLLKTARTMKDLQVHDNLCVQSAAVCEQVEIAKPTKKQKKKNREEKEIRGRSSVYGGEEPTKA